MRDFDSLKATLTNVSQIARGGQKVVYSATHPTYGSIVLKLFFKMDARSQREIEISENSDFGCVPAIHETEHVIYEGADTLCIFEQRVDGEELRKRIERGDYFTLKEAADFLEQGLTFIKQLEGRSIVHRDIKPENIIVSAGGIVYFLDFGIARILGVPSLTKTEAIAGPHTAGYAAPEQFNNLKSDIDSRADLFSIGVVTYECLTGKNPFRDGATSHLDILQRTETITPISFQIQGDTQQQFMGLLSSLMGKFPSRRPKDAAQALNWLTAAKSTLQCEEAKQ
ncbi:MAG: Serine/threonine-protein kinase PknA [Syntrophomonadaceae bacterium]|nr:Serine/threonine-protein kinase PknA [Bacillota bacterium]MBT9147858.1 Serine/threonine-protein kinase PknA [Bacillota bacterium]